MYQTLFVWLALPTLIFYSYDTFTSLLNGANASNVHAQLKTSNRTIVDSNFFYNADSPPSLPLYNHYVCETDRVLYFCRSFYETCRSDTLDCGVSKLWFFIEYIIVMLVIHFVSMFNSIASVISSIVPRR